MSNIETVILGGARTAMTEYSGTPWGGKLAHLTASELGAIAIKGALERTRIAAEEIEHVVMGNALQTDAQAIYGARDAALFAGIPPTTPALTVNRICGSGVQSIISAIHEIAVESARIVVAGGMESMSQAPHVLRGARAGFRLGSEPKLEDMLMAALMHKHCGLYMAQTAEELARRHSISRAAQDEFSLRSMLAGVASVTQGRFKNEIVPIEVKSREGVQVVDTDDHIKETSLEKLAGLRAAFGKEGTVTAGNASGIVDGGAALIVTSASEARARGLTPRARIRSWAVAGVPPEIMGIGPVPAIRKALERARIAIGDVKRYEINEAFAAQYLACEKELGLDRERVNVNGGAIAIGHPLGATGTRLVLTLIGELERCGGGLGVASACIGGGQGIAMLIEV